MNTSRRLCYKSIFIAPERQEAHYTPAKFDVVAASRYKWSGMSKKNHRNRATSVGRRLRGIEGGVSAVRSDVRGLRVSLEPLVPHIGAIENELHDVQSSLDRIEQAVRSLPFRMLARLLLHPCHDCRHLHQLVPLDNGNSGPKSFRHS